MHTKSDEEYRAPALRSFASADEVWEHYKDKGTPEERARLRQALGLDDLREPIRRRA